MRKYLPLISENLITFLYDIVCTWLAVHVQDSVYHVDRHVKYGS